MKKSLTFLTLIGFFVGGTYLTVFFYLEKKVMITEPQLISISKGASLIQVARELSQQNLIDYPRLFVKVGQLYGYDRNLKYGEYEIKPAMNYRDLLEKLTSGDTYRYRVTFPEGDHIYDYARVLDEAGLVERDVFLNRVKDSRLIRKLVKEDLVSLEGYLFPETYAFSREDSVDTIITTMVQKFLSELESLPWEQSGLSRHQWVTLASIVEKETGAAFERPLISSVFHNRLKKGMKLQTDPTIIYGIMNETGQEIANIRKSDIRRPTAYNTYVIKGLPPGPIGNPGREALLAAAQPQPSEFLYFVSQNDGTHIFSKSYKDHLKAVNKFQLDPKMRQGKSWRDLKEKRVQ
jgi:UPF0755 protein